MLSSILLSTVGEIVVSLPVDAVKQKLNEYVGSLKWNELFVKAKTDLVKSFENDNDITSSIEFVLNEDALKILSEKYENFKDLELVSSLREDLENLFRNNSNQNNVDELINRLIKALLFYIRRDYSELYSNIIIYQELEKIGDQIKLLNEKDKEVKISTCTLWQIEDALRKSNSYSMDLDFFDFQEQQIDNDIILSLNNNSIIYIKGENQEESLYYFLRLCKNDINLCDKVLIIKDKESWEIADSIFNDKILVPIFDTKQIIPAHNNKTAIILSLNSCLYDEKCVTIPRRSISNLYNFLSKYIVDKDFIDRLIKNNVTNFQSLKNNLFEGIVNEPTWFTNVDNPSIFAPALLLGKWDENKNDKIVLEYIANEDYEKYILTLNELTKSGDKFIDCYRSYGDKIYKVIDLKTAWGILFKYISASNYQNFINVFKEIVIDEEDRIELGIRQINCGTFSNKLKNGVVISLVYISITDKERYLKYKVVNKCLDSIFKTNKVLNEVQWQAICNVLSILVEANPEYMIDIISKEFKNQNSKIHSLFNVINGALCSYASYPYLLFAIEKALFYKETCVLSINLLQDLCNKPVQSNMVNSPLNTLSKVFCPFFDEIGLGIENRMKLLNKFMNNDKENCWKLLTELLPSRLGGSYDFLQKPYYRVPKYNIDPLSNNETNQCYKSYLDIALNCAGRDLIKFGFILQNTSFIDFGFLKPFIEKVSPLLSDINISDKEKYQFSIFVRKFIYDCRYYKNGWYGEEIVKQFEDWVYNRIIYSIPIFYKLHCFESAYLPLNPEIFIDEPQKYASQWERNEKVQEDEQVNILRSYYKEGIDKLAALFKYVEDNQQIGISLAKSLDYNLSKEIISLLEETNKTTVLYLYVYTVLNSMQTIDAITLIRTTLSDCSIETRFIALKSLSVDSSSLKSLKSLPKDEQDYYYEHINPYAKDLSQKDIKEYFYNLLQANNYNGIHSFIIYNDLDTNDYIELLWKYHIYRQHNIDHTFREYEINRIFKKIYADKLISASLVGRIIKLEISYAKFFYFSYEKPKPLYLMEKLSNDASYIVQIIKLTYLEDRGEKLEYSKEDDELIQFYDQVIRYVHFCPCVDVDGVYHADKFTTWIENYESGINENNQKNVGLRLLGKFFAFFPKGKYPGWLPEEICNTIDTYNNDGLNDSFFIQCLNNRSAHYCNDGNENNLLIEEYKKYAEMYEFSYPITASIFRKLSDYYNDEKQEQKERASHSMF